MAIIRRAVLSRGGGTSDVRLDCWVSWVKRRSWWQFVVWDGTSLLLKAKVMKAQRECGVTLTACMWLPPSPHPQQQLTALEHSPVQAGTNCNAVLLPHSALVTATPRFRKAKGIKIAQLGFVAPVLSVSDFSKWSYYPKPWPQVTNLQFDVLYNVHGHLPGLHNWVLPEGSIMSPFGNK